MPAISRNIALFACIYEPNIPVPLANIISHSAIEFKINRKKKLFVLCTWRNVNLVIDILGGNSGGVQASPGLRKRRRDDLLGCFLCIYLPCDQTEEMS